MKLTGLDKGERLTKDKAKHILFKSMFKMEELAIGKAPFDTGHLRQNITLFPQILAEKYVLTSGAEYSEDLEFGNSPRVVKFDDILEWIKRKGIRNDDSSAWAFAAYVKKKIKEEGVNAQPFFRVALSETKEIWYPQFAKEEFLLD